MRIVKGVWLLILLKYISAVQNAVGNTNQSLDLDTNKLSHIVKYESPRIPLFHCAVDVQ